MHSRSNLPPCLLGPLWASLLSVIACDAPPDPGLAVTAGEREIDGAFARDGAVVTFHAEALDDQGGARIELDIAGKALELALDVAARTFTEDAHGNAFSLADRALLLALRDTIGEDHPQLVQSQIGNLLVRAVDRYAEVPIGRARTRLEIDLGTSGVGKPDSVENSACRNDGVTCFPGTHGQSWAVFGSDLIGGCFAELAHYGDGVCRGRCGAGCAWYDEDYTWDCFDHDVCLDYHSDDDCSWEWDDATDDWVATIGPYCYDGILRPGPSASPVCGNGDIEVGEACDDHNVSSGDGCSAACELEPVSLAVSAVAIAIDRDQQVALRATATMADGSPSHVTGSATWSTSDAAVATVAAGQISGVQPGTAVITAAFAGQTAEVAVTVRDAPCMLTINEVQTAGETAADEWIEIYNGCSAAVQLTGWTLVYRAASATGSSDTSRLVALDGTIQPGEFRLYASAYAASASVLADAHWAHGASSGAIARLGGGIGLRDPAGALVDSVGYGTLAAGHPFAEGGIVAPAPALTASCARSPFDGADSDLNAADFTVTGPGASTPRSPNLP